MESIFRIILAIGAIIGYVMNIVKLCQCDFSAATSWKAEIIYGIGTTAYMQTICEKDQTVCGSSTRGYCDTCPFDSKNIKYEVIQADLKDDDELRSMFYISEYYAFIAALKQKYNVTVKPWPLHGNNRSS